MASFFSLCLSLSSSLSSSDYFPWEKSLKWLFSTLSSFCLLLNPFLWILEFMFRVMKTGLRRVKLNSDLVSVISKKDPVSMVKIAGEVQSSQEHQLMGSLLPLLRIKRCRFIKASLYWDLPLLILVEDKNICLASLLLPTNQMSHLIFSTVETQVCTINKVLCFFFFNFI